MNSIKPIAWKTQLSKDADVEKAKDAMRDRLRKHVDAGQSLEFEEATSNAGDRFLVAMIAEA